MQVSNGNLCVERVSYMLCLMNFSNITFVVLLQTVAELPRP